MKAIGYANFNADTSNANLNVDTVTPKSMTVKTNNRGGTAAKEWEDEDKNNADLEDLDSPKDRYEGLSS